MSIDPYRVWLGIPSDRRPPTYYDILSLEPGESDEAVIRSAAEQRRSYVLSKQGGDHDRAVYKILGQIDEAVATLVVPATKFEYDRLIGLHAKTNKAGKRRSKSHAKHQKSPERIYGEGSGIVSGFAGIMGVISICIGAMVWLSFQMPWGKLAQSPDVNDVALDIPKSNTDSHGAESFSHRPDTTSTETKEFSKLASSLSEVRQPDNCVFKGLSISIAKNGKCVIGVNSEDKPVQFAEADGDKKGIAIFGTSPVWRQTDGRLHVVSDFAQLKDLSGLNPRSIASEQHLLIDNHLAIDDGLLVLSPKERKNVSFGLPRSIMAPIELQIALSGHSDGALLVQFNIQDRTLIVGLHGARSPEPDADPGMVLVAERDKKGNFTNLVRVVQPAGKSMEYDFQIEAPHMDRAALSIGVRSDHPLAIRRMDVAAKFPPSFGMALDQRGQRVLVKRTIEGDAAASAGIKSGDVILQVDGSSANSMQQVLDILATTVIGDEVALTVERFGQRKVFSVFPN
ncbi:PDZ domain-containing protein [Rubripirellula reticaptiva]|uniref:PDZ domain (Also known as DHR or GLGF) n=1 Tax=Rubripirellula reticaptiva TaxID=2528013 RepID=A0A5C6ENR9_9BACT|nr:PDZ domain-containing protein [Rubripirellula reticaptiva]TWU49261.1 PDZ domain (Also known as DHR or GLGF) [Rubripirellula reticaptiva]